MKLMLSFGSIAFIAVADLEVLTPAVAKLLEGCKVEPLEEEEEDFE